MNFDYSKNDFTLDEIKFFNDSVEMRIIKGYIPVIIKINSRVLKLRNSKFFIDKFKTLNSFENLIRKEIDNLSVSDTLEFKIEKILIEKGMTFDKLYKAFKHHQLDALIIVINRETHTRFIKSIIKSLFY